MSDIKNLIELNKLINNSGALKKDLSEASNLITSMFQKKYISKLKDELRIQKLNHQKNPTKEIQLIQAVKPFISQSRHKDVDAITDTLINMTTLMDIQKDFKENMKKEEQENSKKEQTLNNISKNLEKQVNTMNANNTILTSQDDESIKKDGIYDIDETCLLTNQNTAKKSVSNPSIYIYIILIAIILLKS